ncbi:trypsin-like peptidase domain-containing protein [Alteraurantiacibacter aquimixticola]|uniref:Probable periplasmic serine endoprotease DegP-like n=1 Tax=Alteraurantiacibacter aquimixticola TaxID=2489173 RepID=A0A4T3EYB8_9SPHN|nr:trypsin-like peptidase domain-containing protein [Alteraurantiacibacter aquimixticola]TIX49521.1 PDZ domain-containing protein [Alteraurantiacibacter aquimixticola]
MNKDVKPVRYSYGITSALLLGGAALTLVTGFPAGAQVAQNERPEFHAAAPAAGAPGSFADLTEALMPAVVNISTRQSLTIEGRGNRPITREGQSLGSGFLISADGYIVTNNHVVRPDGRLTLEQATVTLSNGTSYDAELVGADPDSDLAVLKITRAEPFPFVRMAGAHDARVGDWVIAIGNPFGLDGTVTAGIISATYRTTGRRGAYDRYIQTDASINSGNSGGPLFDMSGNVIGINNNIISPTGGSVGIGFAIPTDVAAPIVQALINGDDIQRGYLGVQIQPVNADFAEALGIPENSGEFIQSVQPGEAAEAAGLEAGDVVVSVNGQPITRDQSLSYLVANVEPGTTVPVEFIRNGDRRRVNVTVGRRPSQDELNAQAFNPDAEPEEPLDAENSSSLIEDALGVQGLTITPQIARQLGGDADMTGVVVANVDPNADAARKGLARGAVIESANYQRIENLEDLEAQIRTVREEGRDAILLRVRPRRGPSATVPVRLRNSD